MSQTSVRSQVVRIRLFSSVVTTLHPLLGSKRDMGSVCFRWSYADNFGVLARGANCTNVHLARLIPGVKKAGLDLHDISHASGSAHVLRYEVPPASSYCGGTGKRIARIRSVAWTVSSRRRISGRWISSTVKSLSWRSAAVVLSHPLTPASSLHGTLFWFRGSHGQPCAWNSVSSAVIGVFVCLTSCPGAGALQRTLKHFTFAFSHCVGFLRLVSAQVLSYRSDGYRQSGIVPTKDVVSLTVIMTRANHFLMFLHSA